MEYRLSGLLLALTCALLGGCDKAEKPGSQVDPAIPAPGDQPTSTERTSQYVPNPAPVASEKWNAASKADFTAYAAGLKGQAAELKKIEVPTAEQMDTYQAMWDGFVIDGIPSELRTTLESANAKAHEILPLMKKLMSDRQGASPDDVAKLRKAGRAVHDLRAQVIKLAEGYGVDIKFMQ